MLLINSEIELICEIGKKLEQIQACEREKLDVTELYADVNKLMGRYETIQFGQAGIDRLVNSLIRE